ncbi:MAG: S-layer homology domain-containing protein [Anaerovoracaceae bacterium]|nr:S-layer homology domain-containing protein [Bacillota bacterium]MDY2670962.1 S-layer homology domain-containing protein [Anaerovoracaceae bacterium]
MEIMRSEIDGEITRRSRGLIFKAAALVLTVLMVLGTLPAMNVYADSADLSLDAKGAAVMDVETGKLLWGKNADTRLVPASTTKMMTAFVVLDAVSKGEYTLDSEVSISPSTALFSRMVKYSNLPLSADRKYTVRSLMSAMMVSSACAATVALAEFTSGSESAFVDRMNSTAVSLGMDAKFVDSYGGSAKNKVTPESLAKLGRALVLYHPEILEFTSAPSIVWDGTAHGNTNRFVRGAWSANGAAVDGLKTGTTTAAGKCLVTSSTANGRRVITVTMKESNVTSLYNDSADLISYGLSHAEPYTQGDMVGGFLDVNKNQWFASAVQTMEERNLMDGVTDHIFEPDIQITRASIAQILYNCDGKPYMYDTDSFSDVSKAAWFAPAVAWCKSAGVAYGSTSGTFGPDDNITREEMVTMVHRYLVGEGKISAESQADLSGYSDAASVSKYAEDAMEWAVSNGYIAGTPDGRLAPKEFTTRAQTAQFMSRVLASM